MIMGFMALNWNVIKGYRVKGDKYVVLIFAIPWPFPFLHELKLPLQAPTLVMYELYVIFIKPHIYVRHK